MTALAWLFLAAIPVAWALTAASYRIDRAIERRAWESLADEAEVRAEHWQAEAITAEADLAHARRTIAAVVLHAEKHRVAERATVTPIKKARPKKATGGAVGSK